MPPPDNEADFLQNFPNELSYQPFRCPFPGCNASYRRKEHFRRHELKHLPGREFLCSSWGHEFGRSDTLRRHVQQRHKIIHPPSRAQRACGSCHKGKSRCEGGVPCNECSRRKIRCSFSDNADIAEKETYKPSANQAVDFMLEPSQTHHLKREQCINLYFERFHPHWSFVHQGSFDMHQETPLLVQSMVAIGLWARGEQPAQSAAVELHSKLDSAIRDQREKWDISELAEDCSAGSWPIATYQAILLHIIFSSVFNGQSGIDFDLSISLPSAGLALLDALIRSCRRLGMFYYPTILARYKETDLATFVWVIIEEIKRFNLALYRLCGKLSIPDGRDGTRGGIPLLIATELQFPLPTNRALWNAHGKKEWLTFLGDERVVCMNDDCQENWISNSAALLQFSEL